MIVYSNHFTSSLSQKEIVMAHTICTFLLCVCHLQYICSGRDNISTATCDWIYEGGDEIVSAGNIFRLGFFTPNGSAKNDRRLYVGIWYTSSKVIVWVANREKPILNNTSGTFGINNKSGNLEVSDRGNTDTYFSTNLSSSFRSQPYRRTVKLYDNGNLVLTDDRSGVLWESFNNPTDTFLPGMKMDEKLKLTSWISDEDPALGDFSFQLAVDIGGGYSITKSELIKTYWWSGGESANSFIQKQMSITADELLSGRTGTTKNNISGPYVTNNASDRVKNSRLWMRANGTIQYWSRDSNHSMGWLLRWSEPDGQCGVYSACGSSGICTPDSQNYNKGTCTCLPGFEPTNNDKVWQPGKFNEGCKKKSSTCTPGKSNFVPLNVTMVRPNTSPKEITEDKCISKCQDDCSCQAYSYSNKLNDKAFSNLCWLWTENFDDIQEGSTDEHILFLRVDPPSNMGLGLSPPPSVGNQRNGKSSTLRAVIISTSVIFAVALLCSIAFISFRRVVGKKKNRNIKKNPVLQFGDDQDSMDQENQFTEDDKKDIDVPFFELESILAATDNFSQAYKLGQGGFGPVYKGKFPGGEEIAVKRLSSSSGQGLKEFKNEVVLIAKLQHRNLVRLLGYCIRGNEKILLYEYMPNKSLDAFIFDEKLSMLLDWTTRFDIIVGVARGLLYLHQDSRLRIIHRDMKASNILLDEEMNPKISDFGLARIVGRRETESNTNRIMGTYGYMAPEYALEGQFSVKSDAFSFGVVVLEIVSGKKNTGFYDSQLALNLIGYAWSLLKEEKPMTLLDETLVESCNDMEVLKCIIVGLLCVQEDPNDRPNMSNVVFMLSSEIETLPNPKQPAFVTRKRFSGSTSSSTKPETLSKNEITFSEVDGR